MSTKFVFRENHITTTCVKYNILIKTYTGNVTANLFGGICVISHFTIQRYSDILRFPGYSLRGDFVDVNDVYAGQ